MTENNSYRKDGNSPTDVKAGRRRTPWPLIALALIFVVVPFIAWYVTWFGRALDDQTIDEYLSDVEKPRHVQHALVELEKRIAKGDESAKRWYPRVAALSDSPEKEIRLTVAWAMGVDNRSQEFHSKLVKLVDDNEPIVRRNAALSLVGFGDARALPELRAMLRPFTVSAMSEGTALTALTAGSEVRRESLLLRAKAKTEIYDVRSPLDGRIERALVKTGDQFGDESELFVLGPDVIAVGNALEALKRLGTQNDLGEVERYANGVSGMPDDIKKRAAQTAEAIKRRAEQN